MQKKSNLKLNRQQGGFTLVELMVVLALSTISLTFIYYLFIQNSRLYATQEDIAAMHSALRFATARMEMDIQRAGFMAPLDGGRDASNKPMDPRLCPIQNLTTSNTSNGRIQALEFYQPGTKINGTLCAPADSCSVYRKDGNYMAPDFIDLMGNFVSSEEYVATVDANAIVLDASVMNSIDKGTFQRWFYNPNQLLLVKGQGGRIQLAQINTRASSLNSAYATGRLILSTTGITLVRSPVCGTVGRVSVAPVMRVRYRLDRNNNNYDWSLVREVLVPYCSGNAFSGNLSCIWRPQGANDPNPPLPVARNVVDLQFWFTTQNSITGVLSQLDPRVSSSGKISFLQDDAVHGFPTHPIDLRGVFFRITIRSEEEDPSIPWQSFYERKTLHDPMRFFKLHPKTLGSARVRHINKYVQLVNFLIPR